jgi:hypothetical protein
MAVLFGSLIARAYDTSWIKAGQPVSSANLKSNLDEIQTRLLALESKPVSKPVYTVWGRTTCAPDAAVHTGYAGAFGGSQGAMSGQAMCLDDQLYPTSWINWGAALVSRARSTTQTAGNRSEYMQSGDLKCGVCKGAAYTLWGRTSCDANDTVVYLGHIAHIAYDSQSGGANAAGPFCVDDNATGIAWTNWGGNDLVVRAAGAAGNPYVQYLDGRDGLCVVCR